MSYLNILSNHLKNSLFCGFKGFFTFNIATISLIYYSLNSYILSILLKKQGNSILENKYEHFKIEQEKSLYQLNNNTVPFLEVTIIMPLVFLIAHYTKFHKSFKYQYQMYISCIAICMASMVVICFSLRMINWRTDCPCGSLRRPAYNDNNDFLLFNDPTRKEEALNYVTQEISKQLDKETEIIITLPDNIIKEEEIEDNLIIKALRNVKYGKCDNNCRFIIVKTIEDIVKEHTLSLKMLKKKLSDQGKSKDDIDKIIKAIVIVKLENDICKIVNKISKKRFYHLVNNYISSKENTDINLDTLVSSLNKLVISLTDKKTNSQPLKTKYRALCYLTILLTLPLRVINAIMSLGLAIINIIEIPFIFIIEFARTKFNSPIETKNTSEKPDKQRASNPPGSCCSKNTQNLDTNSKILFEEINRNLSDAAGLLYGGFVRDPLIIITFGLICVKNQYGLSPINHLDKIVSTKIEQTYPEKTKTV